MRTSAVFVALLALLCVTGIATDLRSQTPPGQTLSAEGSAALQSIINSAQHPDLRWVDFSPYQVEVKDFYTRTNGTLGWVQNRKPTPQATAMIALFSESDHKGLVPEDYDASRWPARLQKLNNSPSDVDLANFDAAMTVSAMRYIRALHVGRVNPKLLGRKLDVDSRKYDLGEFVCDKIISSSDPAAAVKTVEPIFPGYLRTLDALQRYRELMKVDSGAPLAISAKPIPPGGTYADLPRLTQLLRLAGDLPDSAQLDANSTTYQGPIVEAVKNRGAWNHVPHPHGG